MNERIVAAKKNPIEFARIITKLLIKMPYKSHKTAPITTKEYIARDKSLVLLVFITLIVSANAEEVVHVAATNPITVIKSIMFIHALDL